MAFGKTNTKTIAAAATAFFLLSCLGSAEFFAAPTLKWSLQLEGSGRLSGRGLRKGNAIVAHGDGTKIVATADDGSLHVIQTTNQVKTLAVFVPEELSGRQTECRSGATVVEKNQQAGLYASSETEGATPVRNGVDFVVYAVVDKTILPDVGIFEAGIMNSGVVDRGDGVTSRVLAVGMDGVLLWSVEVPGWIEGKPLVGRDGIYVTHNDNGLGNVSVLRLQPGDGTPVVVATVTPPAAERGRMVPLGPPALRKPMYWEEEEGDGDTEDMVIVAQNWDSGFSDDRGGLYMLSSDVSAFTNADGKDRNEELSRPTDASENYGLVRISSWSFSASSPPMVYGDSIYLGAAAGTLGGFTGDRKSDLSGITSGRERDIEPRWNLQVAPNPRNASQPIRSQPVLDREGELLVVAGVDSDVYGIQTENGRQVWRDNQGSQVLAQPRIFEAGDGWAKVVYVIETQNGRVRQHDLYNGRRYWDYSCADISNQLCQDAVEADFAVTESGNNLYYGDIYGRINSLEVANFATGAPTISPTFGPTVTPTGTPTTTAAPTESPVSKAESPVAVAPVPVASSPASGADEASSEGQDEATNDDEGGTGLSDENNDEPSSIVDQQAAKKEDSSNTPIYIGAAMAGLCVLMIPIVIFAILRKKRKKPSEGKEMIVEIIDDCSAGISDEGESDRFSNEISDSFNGDGIEVEMRSSPSAPTRGTPPNKKKRKKKKNSLPDTPNTVNTLASIEELPEEASAMVVAGKVHDIEDPSIEAVNLRNAFDKEAQRRAPGSKSLEIAIGSEHDNHYLSDDDDDDIPPPPPPPMEDSNQWTWGSLLQMGTAPSSSETNNPTEKFELKKASNYTHPPKTEATIEESVEKESDIVETETEEITEVAAYENAESQSRSETPVPPEEQTPSGQSTGHSLISDAVQNSSPGSMFGSPQGSESDSVGSDDESLYTSYTSMTGGTREKKEQKELSPLSNYVYDQDIRRRDRTEIVNEGRGILHQPDLSKRRSSRDKNKYHFIDHEEHPDDESTLAPGIQYKPHVIDDTEGKYGKSARSKRDSDLFKATNASRNEYSHTPLAQMYDQLAAIGQQRREEKKPAFKRRSKRMEQSNPDPPPPKQEDEQSVDTWGSFLNELAQAEQQFFSPSKGNAKSLLNDSASENGDGTEAA